jgi:single-strand DNA-binding protein
MTIAAVFPGRVGQDPELRAAGQGHVLGFSVATEHREKVDGQWKSVTTWVRVSIFGARAESLSKVLAKGSSVVVRGTLSLREYTDRQGQVRTSLDCRADDVELFGGKAKHDGDGDAHGRGGDRTPRAQAPAAHAAPPADAAGRDFGDYGGGAGDDDIPF